MGTIYQDAQGNEIIVNKVRGRVRLTVRSACEGDMQMGLQLEMTQGALTWLVDELTEYIVDKEKL